MPFYLGRNLQMTFPASLFGDGMIALRDADVIREPARRKGPGMIPAVQSLREIFGDETRGRVAVVAHRHMAMAGLHPAAVLIVHHMAIRA